MPLRDQQLMLQSRNTVERFAKQISLEYGTYKTVEYGTHKTVECGICKTLTA